MSEEEVSDAVQGEATPAKNQRKLDYAARLRGLLSEYKNILVCEIDFVGSNQMQQIRIALRGKAVVLMGKNTVIRKVMREEVANNPNLSQLIPLVAGNVGFVFTNEDLGPIRTIIEENKVPAAAKTGVLAPVDVIVPPGPTGLDPGQTSFFQSLEIATKIMRGSIEIIEKVLLVKTGEKVTASHVGLLSKLNIKPFSYGMIVSQVYENGFVYAAKILDMSQSDLLTKWYSGVRMVAALSIKLGFPTAASVPFSIRNTFRKLLALTFVTDITFKEATEIQSMAANASAAPAGKAEAAEEKKDEPEAEEEEEDEEEDYGAVGGLFGDDDEGEEEEGDEEWDEEEGDEEEGDEEEEE